MIAKRERIWDRSREMDRSAFSDGVVLVSKCFLTKRGNSRLQIQRGVAELMIVGVCVCEREKEKSE